MGLPFLARPEAGQARGSPGAMARPPLAAAEAILPLALRD